MSLMLKSLKNIALASSLLTSFCYADEKTDILENYLTNQILTNPAVENGNIKILEQKPLEQIPNWNAYIVELNVTLKRKSKKIHQKNIVFSNGTYITNDFTNIENGSSLKDLIRPKFKDEYYKKENLISGDENSKHKIAIFSDPLCPFCRTFVPKALKYMMADSKKYAVYYYNLPLPNIHPASVVLVKAVIAAELKKQKPDMIALYTSIQPKSSKRPYYVAYGERDVKKILKVFNDVMGTDIKPSDLKSKEVLDRYNEDIKISEDLMVNGTPSVYVDGEYDKSKQKYKEVE